jgi:hypothetical protein
MQTPMHLSYTPAADGGMVLGVHAGDRPVAFLPLDHLTAMQTAAMILHAAGISHASYDNGHLSADV